MARPKWGAERPATSAVVIYLRVSTEEQAQSNLGLEAQRLRLESYAELRGWPVVSVHIDAGVSGTKRLEQRPALQAAIADLRPGTALLAYSMDRLSRAGAAGIWEVTAAVEARGSSWATLEGAWDTSTAAGRLIVSFLAEVGAYEAARIAENTSKALRAKIARGEVVGNVGLGYRYVAPATHARSDGTTYTVAAHVEPVADELATVRMARRLRTAGLTYEQIAAELGAAGRRTTTGSTTWHVTTVRRLLTRRRLERDAEALTIQSDVPVDLRAPVPVKPPRICPTCGALIAAYGSRRIYCSPKCKAAALRSRQAVAALA